MKVSNNFHNNIYKSPNFGRIVMSPHPEKWDQRVLRAVLNSNTISDIILENEKIGKDTQIRYFRHDSKHYEGIPAPHDVYLTVKGDKGDIFLSSHSTYKFIPGSFFENTEAKDVYHGPLDIGKDLVEQIRAMDHQAGNDFTSRSLAYFKKIGADIVYENPVEIKPYE